MKPTYYIKDWDKHFENHESRKVKRSYWVPIPNRHDGKSFRRIAMHADGVDVFAAWVLILEAASKMPTRGVLADEDGPLDADDLAAMTGFPSRIFDAAFNLLTQEKFGWITSSTKRVLTRKSPETSRHLPQSPVTTEEPALEQNGTEGNGNERKGTEGNMDSPPFTGNDFLSTLSNFERHRREIKKPLKPTGRKLLYGQLRKMGEEKAIEAMAISMANGWQGVFEPNGTVARPSKTDISMASAQRVAAKYEQRS